MSCCSLYVYTVYNHNVLWAAMPENKSIVIVIVIMIRYKHSSLTTIEITYWWFLILCTFLNTVPTSVVYLQSINIIITIKSLSWLFSLILAFSNSPNLISIHITTYKKRLLSLSLLQHTWNSTFTTHSIITAKHWMGLH